MNSFAPSTPQKSPAQNENTSDPSHHPVFWKILGHYTGEMEKLNKEVQQLRLERESDRQLLSTVRKALILEIDERRMANQNFSHIYLRLIDLSNRLSRLEEKINSIYLHRRQDVCQVQAPIQQRKSI